MVMKSHGNQIPCCLSLLKAASTQRWMHSHPHLITRWRGHGGQLRDRIRESSKQKTVSLQFVLHDKPREQNVLVEYSTAS